MNIRKLWLFCTAALIVGAAGSAQAEQTIKLGVLNDKSSLYADLTGTGSVTAAQMAVEDFGKTVLNRRIEVITADHQNKPDIGSAITTRWIETEKVSVIIDVPTSSVAFAVQEVTRNLKVPLLISGAASSDLTGKACSPMTVHWTYDSYALAAGAARGIVQAGGTTWFFLAQDNLFGQALQRDVTRFVEEAGGKVLGGVRHPLNSTDFASYLVQAEASKAKIIGLANAGSDFTNAIKQAGEFGLIAKGIRIAGLSVTINDVHSLGLKTAQGVQFVTPFYWDMTPETRAWSKRFFDKEKKMPNHIQAGVYGAVMHYLNAVKAANTDDGPKVVDQMKKTPINDFFTKNGSIRVDGRVMREFHLMEVKAPGDSKYAWDYFKLVKTMTANDTAIPLKDSECALVKK
ncbi:MAG: ABC transporter substrate-binding protein [Alphaproteobacteria bacterium]